MARRCALAWLVALLLLGPDSAVAQNPTITSCPSTGNVQAETDSGVEYATNGGTSLNLPQCLDPAEPCDHATDAETPDDVTLTAEIQVGTVGDVAVYVPVDRAHRECVPTSSNSGEATLAACAGADIGHVSQSGVQQSEAEAESNCLTSQALSQYCSFVVSSYRFMANSIAADEYVTLVAEDSDGHRNACEFTVTVLDLTDPVVVCPSDVTDGVTDDSQPYASEAGGLVLPPLTPISNIATDNVGVGSLVAQLETSPETCLPVDGSTSGAMFDACQGANIAVADGQGQGGPSRLNCEAAGDCVYTAPTRETVTPSTQFVIGDSTLVFLAQDTALDEFGGTRRNAAECRITVTVTDNQSPVIDQDSCVDVDAFTDQSLALDTVVVADSCTSTLVAAPNTVTTSDEENCNLIPTPDFGVTDGVCEDVDSTVATCAYVAGSFSPHAGERYATVRGHYEPASNSYIPSVAFPAGLTDPCEWADLSGTDAEDLVACSNVETDGPACIYSTNSCRSPGDRFSAVTDNSGPGLSVTPSIPEQCIVCFGTDAEEAAEPTTCELQAVATCTRTAGSGSCAWSGLYQPLGGEASVDVSLDTEFPVSTGVLADGQWVPDSTYGCATTVVFTATDPSGNSDSCEIQVTVRDDQEPVIDDTTCVDSTAQADADVAFTTTAGHLALPSVQAVDNHYVEVTPSLIEQCLPVPGTPAQELDQPTTCFLNSGTCLVSMGSGTCTYYAPETVTAATEFPVGTVTVMFTAEDGSPLSGADTCLLDVTIEDLQAPWITCPPDFLDAQTNAPLGDGPGFGYGDTASWNAAGLPTPQMPTTIDLATDNSDPVYGGEGNGLSAIVVERLLENGERAEISHLATGVADDNSVQFPIGNSTVFYTAYDRHSPPNSATCSITVRVTDVEPPIVTCPTGDPAVVGSVDDGHDYATIAGGGVVIPETGFGTGDSIAVDNADGVGLGVVSISRELVVHGPPHAGSNTVEVPDSCTSTLVAAPNTVTTSDEENCNLIPTPDFGVTDGVCDDVDATVATCAYIVGSYSTRSSLADDTQFPIGVSEVVYTAVDAQGNEHSCSINVRVVDLEPPVIDESSCTDVFATTDPDQPHAVVDPCDWADMSGTDAEDQVECSAAGDGTCTYSLGSCQGTHYIGDLVFPSIVATDNSGPHKIHIVPMDVSGAPVTASTTFPIGSTTVVFTVSDEASVPNTVSCSITVTVVDDQSPEIACPADITDAVTDVGESYASSAGRGITTSEQRTRLVGNNHQGSLAQDNSDNNSGDGVASISVYFVQNAGQPDEMLEPVDSLTQFPIGTSEVRYVAEDHGGNSDSCSISVTVSDNQSPVIVDESCTNPFAISDTDSSFSTTEGTVVLPTVDATDNHVVSITPVIFEQCVVVPGTSQEELIAETACALTDGVCTVSAGTGNCIYEPGGADERLCTAKDSSLITCEQPADGATVCPNSVDCVFTPDPNGGSQGSCALTSQSDCDASLDADADGNQCMALGCTYSHGSDSADVTATTEFLIGRTTVVLIAADEATPPNSDTCSVVVTVQDEQAPVITCPADVEGVTAAEQGHATPSAGVALPSTENLAVDNSDPVFGASPGAGISLVLVELEVPGGTPSRIEVEDDTQFHIGVSTLVYTAYDRSTTPNSAECTIAVTVVDNQPPIINSSAVLPDGRVACDDFTASTDVDVAYATVAGSSVIFPDVGAATTDNSGSFTISAETDSGVVVVGDGADTGFRFTLDPAGTRVTFTATDDADNADNACTLTVFVADQQPPDIVCPAAITDAQTDPGDATASVAGGGVSIQYISDQPYVPGSAGLATDNTDSFYAAGGPGAAITNIAVFVVRENGEREAVDAATQFGIGDSTIVYVATDSASPPNEAECSMLLTVSDVEPPVLGTGGDCSAADVHDKTTDPGQSFGTYDSLDSIMPPVADNSGLPVTLEPSVDGVAIDASYQFSYVATTTVTWTATDNAGVTASCATMVTVIDTEAPVLGDLGDCSAWDMTISASFDQDWFDSCSLNAGTGQMDCGTDVLDPQGNPPIYGRALLPNIPVTDNSNESLDDASTITVIAVPGGADPNGAHACTGCSDTVTVYNRDPLPANHPVPHAILFDVADHTSQASAVYTVEYTVADSSGGSAGSPSGSCTVRVTVIEEDDCVVGNDRCGPHSVGCIDLAATSFGLHESEANRIYYEHETFLGTIDRGDNSPHVTFSTEAQWREYYDNYASGPGTNPLLENSRPGYQCICEHGWEGDDCRTDTDECLAGSFLCTANEPCNGPCENAAPCKDSSSVLQAGESAILQNAYRCECDFGFSGINCDQYNECESDPCYQLATLPPNTVEATDKFLCPVAIICTDPDHTTTDDYICTCPACDDAMFSSANIATLGAYLETHVGLRSYISSQLNEQQEVDTGTQQVCVLTDAKCAFTPSGRCPAGCSHTSDVPTCTGYRDSDSLDCSGIDEFLVSGAEADCPTEDGCTFAVIDTCTAREGCTDANALNYDPRAALDDGTCVSVVYGCMDPLAANFDPSATKYDPSGQNGELCKAAYCSITGLMPTCPDGCSGPVASVCDCSPSPATTWSCPNIDGAAQAVLTYSESNPYDECDNDASACSHPGTRLCPVLAIRGMTPDSCELDRQSFVCTLDGNTTAPFECHDPNPYWPGDYTCDCVYAHSDGFYNSTVSDQCGEDEVVAGVSNYELTRLADTIPSLRTRICTVLGTDSDDCPDSYLTASGRRRNL